MSDAQVVKHRQNSYDAVRCAAALAVLVSHHYALSGLSEPRVSLMGSTLGGAAVAVFFSISGYLIFISAERSRNFSVYMSARILRIFPNLAVSTVITSLFLLFFYRNWQNVDGHIRYIWHNSFVFLQPVLYPIPGIFEGHPNTSINGSLWSLQYEFLMYLVIFPIALLPRLASWFVIIGLLAVFSSMPRTSYSFELGTFVLTGAKMGYFGSFFLSGALIAIQRSVVPSLNRPMMVLGLAAFLGWRKLGLDTASPVFALATAAVVIGVCELTVLKAWSRLGDMSYGIYIFAFPVQQLMLDLLQDFATSMVCSALLTVMIAQVTWHGLERPALKQRGRIVAAVDLLSAGAQKIGKAARRRSWRGGR